ncbi:beta-glucosidase/6-phospho-beta-glucosidase/beta-galactosidase [Microbacterium endophyticum]|uniref:Beta-glucosidase/6-phospho-beta-glucosidase/beta-galactosidase n=1 Tax=Microbacterium endophyticum TaxID=1526412 RepID=A0A7W4V3W9_9MICO|nr:family 1 glycosylhydrolase [Microbacterium endophyticum]MBB2976408.1 beta-glucosidase/6-phospho-beta-glucosidase/beta-galactosidase [Microbacterium endophyticum]NIK35854.1 beta-glucosidase/6-phospho-beta-glucosidase/beta-galactosidase [Microbacterium endophyticum]
MTSLQEPFARGGFTWLLGIEDTCVYPVSSSETPLDEHILTGHDTAWREDLTLARELGATAIRYGVSWPVVHVAPGVFNWAELDEVIPFAVDHLGLEIVADLVHYGTPRWLVDSFADPGYPDAIADFARAFASRYRSKVTHFTPLNEPVTTASFCGLRGVWPPRLFGWDGWVAVAVPIALGMARTTAAIREVNPDAVIVHVEAATVVHTDERTLDEHAALIRDVGWLSTDFLLGRVDEDHPLWTWLLEHGAHRADLDWLLHHPAAPDFVGVNYYPDLTPRRVALVDGEQMQISYDKWTQGLREALEGFATRYQLPLIITETSIEGDDALRARWLRDSAVVVEELREQCDIRGYTWWPMFDFVDWSWASGGANVEEFVVENVAADGTKTIGPAPSLGDPSQGKTAFLRRMGLVRLDEGSDATLSRVPTPAATLFKELS